MLTYSKSVYAVCALSNQAPHIQGAHRYVIAHCGLAFEEQAPTSDADVLDARLVCLGDDPDGQAIEVIAVEGSKDELIVIHAMALRKKYTDQYGG